MKELNLIEKQHMKKRELWNFRNMASKEKWEKLYDCSNGLNSFEAAMDYHVFATPTLFLLDKE